MLRGGKGFKGKIGPGKTSITPRCSCVGVHWATLLLDNVPCPSGFLGLNKGDLPSLTLVILVPEPDLSHAMSVLVLILCSQPYFLCSTHTNANISGSQCLSCNCLECWSLPPAGESGASDAHENDSAPPSRVPLHQCEPSDEGTLPDLAGIVSKTPKLGDIA